MSALLDRLRGQGYKTRLMRPLDEFWDRRLGVRTFGYIPAVGAPNAAAWQGHYEATSYRDLFRMLRRVGLGRDDVYVDLGCGMGRTVFVANWLGARHAVGVEVNASLIGACRANALRSHRDCRGVEFVQGYAQDFSQDETTVLFLFHPFGRGTLQTVIEGLGASLRAVPRRLRLVYFNAACDDVLAASGFLRRIDRWEPGADWNPSTGRYPASFWET